MSTSLAPQETAPELLERVVLGGDLARLQPAERLQYYREVCSSVGLNPLTRPFEYLQLSGKLTLYARKDATDQLRALHNISVESTEREVTEGVYVVTAYVKNSAGRRDSDIGAVPIVGLKGEALSNAMMKAHTKAKRRATLSICGLGMLDESEVDSIPGAKVVQGEAVPVLPATETVTTPGTNSVHVTTEPAPFAEWMEAIQNASAKSLPHLWKGVTAPDVWSTWSDDEQAHLVAEKDAAKARLGIK